MLFLLSDDVSKHRIMNKCLLRFSLCVLFLFVLTRLEARHIVGGEISYVFRARVGNVNTYDFTMKIYRDCSPNSNGGPFDAPGIIAIYNSAGTLVSRITAPIFSQNRITNPQLKCFQSQGLICVEVGIYKWSAALPVINLNYIVEYQRCCRNSTVTNIFNSENTGATYDVEISAQAQAANNSSPFFNDFPPTLICLGEPLNYDHSASDADGDQLVYEFCAPYAGGGSGGNGSGCGVAVPDPPCPPPFTPVSFSGPYSPSDPMGGTPTIRINPNTGVISGVPNAIGQFVVGVCVSEYRNGTLIGKLRRDFQFNVVSCKPLIFASIRSDGVVNRNEFVLQVCGSRAVTIDNTSAGRSNVTSFEWRFRIGGVDTVLTEWSPSLVFADTGTYRGSLILRNGTFCNDTAYVTLRIFNLPRAGFSYSYDTCISGPVTIRDNSFSPNGRITGWRYTFDNGVDSVQNPVHQFVSPGLKDLKLRITDLKGCFADTLLKILWQPAPKTIIIKPSTYIGCSPAQIFFNNLSVPIDSTYRIDWTFGDSSRSGAISPTHNYLLPGIYSVGIDLVSPIGCRAAARFPNLIVVKQGVVADFDYSPREVNSFNNKVSFVNKSVFSQFSEWYFGVSGRSVLKNPVYTFRDTGVQVVKLVVSNSEGCRDTILKLLDIKPAVSYFLPNAFSPNELGQNDLFKGKGFFEGIRDFKMQIFNKWGELVFSTGDPNEGWNGRKNNIGDEMPEGIYVFLVGYLSPRGEVGELKGFASLIR
jgi:gliding motility-associated-like protein